MQINETLRAQHIKRWTIVATAKDQSLAEHTFNVTMLVRDFCRRMQIDDTVMMKAAMEHDLDEIFTGDIPTPAKTRFRREGIDPSVIEGRQKNVDGLDDSQRKVLKALDILESVHFLEDFGIGKRAVHVANELKCTFYDKIDDIEWDDVKRTLTTMADIILTTPEG